MDLPVFQRGGKIDMPEQQLGELSCRALEVASTKFSRGQCNPRSLHAQVEAAVVQHESEFAAAGEIRSACPLVQGRAEGVQIKTRLR